MFIYSGHFRLRSISFSSLCFVVSTPPFELNKQIEGYVPDAVSFSLAVKLYAFNFCEPLLLLKFLVNRVMTFNDNKSLESHRCQMFHFKGVELCMVCFYSFFLLLLSTGCYDLSIVQVFQLLTGVSLNHFKRMP